MALGVVPCSRWGFPLWQDQRVPQILWTRTRWPQPPHDLNCEPQWRSLGNPAGITGAGGCWLIHLRHHSRGGVHLMSIFAVEIDLIGLVIRAARIDVTGSIRGIRGNCKPINELPQLAILIS